MEGNNYQLLAVEVVKSIGLDSDVHGLNFFQPVLEKMRSEGAVVLLKWDGERQEGDNGPYTALVSGKALGGEFFRIDAHTMEDALSYIVVEYARRQWGFLK